MKGSYHILTSRIERSSNFIRSVGHDDHVAGVRRESSISSEVITHVHGIVNASAELVLRAEVVDADQKRLLSWHFENVKILDSISGKAAKMRRSGIVCFCFC